MKGIIFNLLEEVVVREYGEDAWDALLEEADVDGAYTAVGTYPHEQLLALVGAGARATGMEADDLVRWFGRRALPLLADRYPTFFSGHRSTRGFLLTLNEVIHPEVRKLFPGAFAPSFKFDISRDDAVGLAYTSHRNLCAFAEGLIEGAADHFGEKVAIEQPTCTRRGDVRCWIWASFSPQ